MAHLNQKILTVQILMQGRKLIEREICAICSVYMSLNLVQVMFGDLGVLGSVLKMCLGRDLKEAGETIQLCKCLVAKHPSVCHISEQSLLASIKWDTVTYLLKSLQPSVTAEWLASPATIKIAQCIWSSDGWAICLSGKSRNVHDCNENT